MDFTELADQIEASDATIARAAETSGAPVSAIRNHPIRSFSAIKEYLACPKRAWFKYVEKRRQPMGVALAIGRAVHKGSVETSLRPVMAGNPLPTMEEVLDATRSAIAAETAEVDWSLEKPEAHAHHVDRALDFAALYRAEVAPHMNPIGIERRFEVNVDGMVLTGFVDVINRLPTGQREFRDIKTSTFAPPAWGDPGARAQLGLYALALDDGSDGFEGARGAIDVLHMTLRKDGTPSKKRHLPIILDEAELSAEAAAVRDVVHFVYEATARGDYPRSPTACFEYFRPCEHMRECFPERARAVERAEAAKIAGFGEAA